MKEVTRPQEKGLTEWEGERRYGDCCQFLGLLACPRVGVVILSVKEADRPAACTSYVHRLSALGYAYYCCRFLPRHHHADHIYMVTAVREGLEKDASMRGLCCDLELTQ